MIEVKNITKTFGDIKALSDVSATIREESIFGLVGTNGSGKSTLLKILSGILFPEAGEVLIDGEILLGNVSLKEKFFYISDDQFFLSNSTPEDMMMFYATFYPNFDKDMFVRMMSLFELDKSRKINTFSKGMKKQLSVILGVSASTKYIYCDETFDGLDPVMRQSVKSIFAEGLSSRGLTPIIASHNLRELEDICDHVGLLHKGGILFSKDLEDMKLNINKVQVIFDGGFDISRLEKLDIMINKKVGQIYTLTLRGDMDLISDYIKSFSPIYFDIIPLSLEEIFISETEVKGYDIKKIIF